MQEVREFSFQKGHANQKGGCPGILDALPGSAPAWRPRANGLKAGVNE